MFSTRQCISTVVIRFSNFCCSSLVGSVLLDLLYQCVLKTQLTKATDWVILAAVPFTHYYVTPQQLSLLTQHAEHLLSHSDAGPVHECKIEDQEILVAQKG